ncbi:hypothetical protein HY839_04195 [Candidatus Azambacteria bacterium]|nr:hypothetical protein [Candidatus Azambacteria bacterium]
MNKKKREKIGRVAQKALILLCAGATLSFTRRPDASIRIIQSATKEWRRINQRSLRDAIRRLYQSKFVDYREHKDGIVTLVLSEEGERRALRYDPNNVRIVKPKRWDHLWRMVLFDIPERHKKGRDALAGKLKHIGFFQMQKSVFIYPYPCRDEIEFLAELFEIRPYVRFVVAQETDIDLDLQERFKVYS